jgi:hypothetical protein
MSRERGRSERARDAYHIKQGRVVVQVAMESRANELAEWTRQREQARAIVEAIDPALRSLEAASFPGLEMITTDHRKPSLFRPPEPVEEPGWWIFTVGTKTDSDYTGPVTTTKYYLLASGTFFIDQVYSSRATYSHDLQEISIDDLVKNEQNANTALSKLEAMVTPEYQAFMETPDYQGARSWIY